LIRYADGVDRSLRGVAKWICWWPLGWDFIPAKSSSCCFFLRLVAVTNYGFSKTLQTLDVITATRRFDTKRTEIRDR
jgi:hypothetical protein